MINILYLFSRGDAGAGGENYQLTLFRNLGRKWFQLIVVLLIDGSRLKSLNI